MLPRQRVPCAHSEAQRKAGSPQGAQATSDPQKMGVLWGEAAAVTRG